jgi:hypothetical protein
MDDGLSFGNDRLICGDDPADVTPTESYPPPFNVISYWSFLTATHTPKSGVDTANNKAVELSEETHQFWYCGVCFVRNNSRGVYLS